MACFADLNNVWHTPRRQRSATMFKFSKHLFQPEEIRRQIRFFKRLGNSRAVSAYVPSGDPGAIFIQFEHQIGPQDVLTQGNLAPLTIAATKRRGAKRSIGLTLTQEAAEALYETLGKAVKEVRRRKRFYEAANILFGIFAEVALVRSHSVYPINGKQKKAR